MSDVNMNIDNSQELTTSELMEIAAQLDTQKKLNTKFSVKLKRNIKKLLGIIFGNILFPAAMVLGCLSMAYRIFF